MNTRFAPGHRGKAFHRGYDEALPGQLAAKNSHIAVVIGCTDFIGEQERINGFMDGMRAFATHHQVSIIAGGFGIDHLMYECVKKFLSRQQDINAVYTVGGGNAGILRAFDEQGVKLNAFIGHDLDRENRALMQAGKIDALIEHDL